ncbi:hypothetical protein J6590_021678, partial [Homalodisca vitripennis]
MKSQYVSERALEMLSDIVGTNKLNEKYIEEHFKETGLKTKKANVPTRKNKRNAPDDDYIPPKGKKQDKKGDVMEKYLRPRQNRRVSYENMDEEEYLPPKENKRKHKNVVDEENRPST